MRNIIIFLILIVVVIILQVVSGYLIYQNVEGWPERGTFGDMFGAVNTLFSGLAFAGIIYAIFLQHKELSLQRRELELTREELKRSAEAQEKSERALSDQANALLQTAKLNSLNLMPSLVLKTWSVDSKVVLLLQNVGSNSAFNVDLLALGLYSTENIEPNKFIENHVKKQGTITQRILNTTDGIYGVYDRLCHAIVPQHRQVSCFLEFPIPPFNIYVLLQFCDMQGNNYHQIYWFFSKAVDEDKESFRLGDINPKVPCVGSRINFNENLDLVTEDDSKIPDYVNEGFAVNWPFSIPSGYIKTGLPEVEDRGNWQDI